MNEDPPMIPGSPPVTPVPPKPPSRALILYGFLSGIAPWLLSIVPSRNYGGIPYLIFSCFGLPVIAVILAIIPRTRRFGLGLLLASGVGWLILGAICGGLFNSHR